MQAFHQCVALAVDIFPFKRETGKLCGVTLKGSKPAMMYREKLVDKLLETINGRFNLDAHGVINATRICSFKCWPDSDSDALEGYCSWKTNSCC